MIIDGDVERLPAGELRASATASIATGGNLLVAGHSLDIEMEQIPRRGMLIAHHGRGGRPPRAADNPFYAATATLWKVEVTASNV